MKLLSLLLLLSSATTLFAQTPASQTEALRQWRAGAKVSKKAVSQYGLDSCFRAEPISNAVFARMKGKSYPEGCSVPLTDLRYVRALHYDLDGTIHIGEMVCNKAIAQDLVEIFRELYKHKYPIQRMVLIDQYDADDERSMRDNNSSCFCYRVVAGTKVLSHHARGMAVDINTLYNPYYKRRKDGTLFVQPATGEPYCDRTRSFPYRIDKNDLCCRLFIQHGFEWGGSWTSCKDFQHFEK